MKKDIYRIMIVDSEHKLHREYYTTEYSDYERDLALFSSIPEYFVMVVKL